MRSLKGAPAGPRRRRVFEGAPAGLAGGACACPRGRAGMWLRRRAPMRPHAAHRSADASRQAQRLGRTHPSPWIDNAAPNGPPGAPTNPVIYRPLPHPGRAQRDVEDLQRPGSPFAPMAGRANGDISRGVAEPRAWPRCAARRPQARPRCAARPRGRAPARGSAPHAPAPVRGSGPHARDHGCAGGAARGAGVPPGVRGCGRRRCPVTAARGCCPAGAARGREGAARGRGRAARGRCAEAPPGLAACGRPAARGPAARGSRRPAHAGPPPPLKRCRRARRSESAAPRARLTRRP